MDCDLNDKKYNWPENENNLLIKQSIGANYLIINCIFNYFQ